MNPKDGTIYITKAEEDSWLISIKADADDARILRGVFTDAARKHKWDGVIVWDWDSKLALCRASNDRAYVAMDRARRAVNRVTEDMFARQHREASK
jgi:hypothetical protein